MWKLTLYLCAFVLVAGGITAQESITATEEEQIQESAPDHFVPVYKVTITNITAGQIFAPVLVASHNLGVRVFELGREARPQLEILAETGNIRPLAEWLRSRPEVKDIAATPSFIPPGESVTLFVRPGVHFRRVSVAGMMLPTNDGFVALNGVRGPRLLHARSYFPPAFDAGTEINDELCDSIPSPDCGGNGGEDEEGVVHIHSGIHGIGHIIPARRDWKNPVAKIRIRHILVDPNELATTN
jgi:hypothetical protein